MKNVVVFSDDTDLRDMINQLDDYTVAYFSTELYPKELPDNIELAIFDFDVVPLSLLGEWSQFPRLHLPKMVVVSAENLAKVDEVLDRLDNYILCPLSVVRLRFSLEKIPPSEATLSQLGYLSSESKRWLPLIMGYADMLIHHSDINVEANADEIVEFANVIRMAAENLDKLIMFVVNWMEYENVRYSHFENISSKHLIGRANESERYLNLKSQKLYIYAPDDLPKIRCDERKIRFVIRAILENASMYSNENTNIDLYMTTENGFMLFGIRDYGVGISGEFKDRVFEKHSYGFSIDPDDKYYRFGMNLYFCKQIIEMHGGKIWFGSEEGVGTTFYFTLPLAE